MRSSGRIERLCRNSSLLFVVCALIGGVIGYFSGKYALNELTGSIEAAGAFFGTRIAPWLMLALAVIVPAVCVPIYRAREEADRHVGRRR